MIFEDWTKWWKLPIRVEIDFEDQAREGSGNYMTFDWVEKILNKINLEAESDYYSKHVDT